MTGDCHEGINGFKASLLMEYSCDMERLVDVVMLHASTRVSVIDILTAQICQFYIADFATVREGGLILAQGMGCVSPSIELVRHAMLKGRLT